MATMIRNPKVERTSSPFTLPPEYTPKDIDILCGRGNIFSNHTGNQNFGKLIRTNMDSYLRVTSRKDKTEIIENILKQIKSTGAVFVALDSKTKTWYQLDDVKIHKKISHAIRDNLQKETVNNSRPPPSETEKKKVKDNWKVRMTYRRLHQQRQSIGYSSSPDNLNDIPPKIISETLHQQRQSIGYSSSPDNLNDIPQKIITSETLHQQRQSIGYSASADNLNDIPKIISKGYSSSSAIPKIISETVEFFDGISSDECKQDLQIIPTTSTTKIKKDSTTTGSCLHNEYPDQQFDFKPSDFF